MCTHISLQDKSSSSLLVLLDTAHQFLTWAFDLSNPELLSSEPLFFLLFKNEDDSKGYKYRYLKKKKPDSRQIDLDRSQSICARRV